LAPQLVVEVEQLAEHRRHVGDDGRPYLVIAAATLSAVGRSLNSPTVRAHRERKPQVRAGRVSERTAAAR